MIKVTKVNAFGNSTVYYKDRFLNSLIFIGFNEHVPLNYSSVFRYDLMSKNIDCFQFPYNVRSISRTNTFPLLYYTSVNCSGESSSFDFRKLNCIDFSDQEILSIVVEDDREMPPHFLPELYGMNDRYMIAFLPRIHWKYGYPHFNSMLLIDSYDQRCYRVPDKIAKLDTLLRIKEIMISKHNSPAQIVFKTGRINWDEKEELWHYQKPYFDQLENLIMINANTYIADVIAGKEIGLEHIVDSCDFNSAFTFYEFTGKQLKYGKINFEENISELISYDISSKQKLVTKAIGIYEQMISTDDSIYAIEKNRLGAKIYDTSNREIVFQASSNEKIEYFTGNYAVTSIWNQNNHCSLYIHFFDNSFTKLGEGKLFFIDKQQHTLIILK